jgi:hypothetical protein
MPTAREYEPQTAAATLRAIAAGVDPWLALGQFQDDWRHTEPHLRSRLLGELPPTLAPELTRWGALLAAAVEWLCAQDGEPFPEWTRRPEYRLTEPWFLYPGWRLRAWQLVETPAPFKARNIFGGDRILARA